MKWTKLGLVYGPVNSSSWQYSHAYIPTPVIYDDFIRVFISSWDKLQVGRLGYIDVSLNNPTEIRYISHSPSLNIGDEKSFDHLGITPMSYIKSEEVLYMLYTGWGEHSDYPYTLFTGLAVSDNRGKSFSRIFNTPILGTIKGESTIRTAAWIHYDPTLLEYWIWYVGGEDWFYADNKYTPTYDLRLIRSDNLFTWEDKQSTLVMSADITRNEYAIGRPCVLRENGIYKLFYSSRRYKHGYCLGYAESENGYDWIRKDEELNFPRSDVGWDSKMQCFSYVLPTKYGTYMFYNGNEHGKAGFGVAILDE